MKRNISIEIKEIWHNNIMLELAEPSLFEGNDELSFEELFYDPTPAGTPQIEFTTCGILEKIKGGIAITYKESEITGMNGATTQFFIANDGSVVMSRDGENAVNLAFEKDKNYICPNGDEPFLVTTRKIENSISENGGTLDICYSINVCGVETEHNEFNINIK